LVTQFDWFGFCFFCTFNKKSRVYMILLSKLFHFSIGRVTNQVVCLLLPLYLLNVSMMIHYFSAGRSWVRETQRGNRGSENVFSG
jgi:hypothetical protein